MSEVKTVENVQTFTHRVLFKRKDLEPELINSKQAEALQNARGNPKYPRSTPVEVGKVQCELGDIQYIERMSQKHTRRGWYACGNDHCDRGQHRAGQRCDYDLTGECIECGEKVMEKSRTYLLARFGRVMCHTHSPFGHAETIFPGDPSPELSRMRGLAAFYIDKGLSDEEVVEAVNRDLTKRKAIGGDDE